MSLRAPLVATGLLFVLAAGCGGSDSDAPAAGASGSTAAAGNGGSAGKAATTGGAAGSTTAGSGGTSAGAAGTSAGAGGTSAGAGGTSAGAAGTSAGAGGASAGAGGTSAGAAGAGAAGGGGGGGGVVGGSGGGGGGGGAAGAGGVQNAGAKQVFCSGVKSDQCDATKFYCCVESNGSGACVTTPGGCAEPKPLVGCDDISDCGSNEICCLRDSGNHRESQCETKAVCAGLPNSKQLCATAAECGGGACVGSSEAGLGSYGTCQ